MPPTKQAKKKTFFTQRNNPKNPVVKCGVFSFQKQPLGIYAYLLLGIFAY